MTENAASTVSETETINTAETSQGASSEPVADDSEKSDLTSTSGQSDHEELMHKLAEFTANTESVASIEEELKNIPQVLSEPQNEQCSHSDKETGVDKNGEELENLDSDHTKTGNVDTSDTLNTAEIDSRTSVAQSQNDHAAEVQSVLMTLESSSVTETRTSGESQTLDDHATEAQSVSMTPESLSLAETRASTESETLAVKQDEPVARHDVPEGLNTTEESDITEISNLSSSRENAVEESVQILSPQVTADETPTCTINEDSRTSQMYPNLDSVTRESGTNILRTCPNFFLHKLSSMIYNVSMEVN